MQHVTLCVTSQVLLYGSPNCQFTKIQFQMFGVNASKQVSRTADACACVA